MRIAITTKFDIGQKAVAFSTPTRKLKDIEISEVQFDTDLEKTSIWYRDRKTNELFRESDIYNSREEFIAQL